MTTSFPNCPPMQNWPGLCRENVYFCKSMSCNCIIRANSHVFTTFYFRFRHWVFWTKLIATTRLKTFQYRLEWTCIHKNLIACHSPKFKICVGSRIILPVTLLQPTKTDDRKRSNWPPDVNQIVFHLPPRRSIWKFTARAIICLSCQERNDRK